MSRGNYLGWIGTLLLAAAMALLMLRPAAGERWFWLYGPAIVALALALPLALVMARRLATARRSRWRVALVVVPLVSAAVLQIGFWTAFFASGSGAAGLAMMRAVLREAAGPYLAPSAALLALALGGILWDAGRDTGTDPTETGRRQTWTPID